MNLPALDVEQSKLFVRLMNPQSVGGQKYERVDLMKNLEIDFGTNASECSPLLESGHRAEPNL